SRQMHPFIGFMAGWISMVAGFSGAIGAAALAILDYGAPLLGMEDVGKAGPLIAAAIICGAGLNHAIGLRIGSMTQNTIVLLKLSVLVALGIIGWGFVAIWGAPNPEQWSVARTPAEPLAPNLSLEVLCSQLMWISFSYAGYNAAVYIAGEAQSPANQQRQSIVPRAMLVGTAAAMVIYVALNALLFAVVPAGILAGNQNVALIAASAFSQASLGPVLPLIVGGTIVVSLLTSILAMVQAAPRVYQQMARDGMLPKFFDAEESSGAESSKAESSAGRLPLRCLALQVALAVALVFISDLVELIEYTAFLLMISSAMTVSCLLLPSMRGTTGNRPLLGWPVTPILFIVVALVTAFFAFRFRWETRADNMMKILLVLPLGALLYAAMRWFRQPT
ncbi:MAG: APC family permease, partial [Planctomycetota bacterium]